MRVQQPRSGKVVHIKGRPVAFSFFPTYKGKKREGLHSTLFATDPWNIIHRRIEEHKDASVRKQSLAFQAQARDFFVAAQNSDISAAKPLLLYYSFLNLAKCFSVWKKSSILERVKHGLSETIPTTPGAIHGSVTVYANAKSNAFALFADALDAQLPAQKSNSGKIVVKSQDFLAQVLVGHRILGQADGFKERFINLDRIEYMQNTKNKTIWLRSRAYADDFKRLDYPLTALSKCMDNVLQWQYVHCDHRVNDRRIIEAQTENTIPYNNRPSELIGCLSKQARPRLWRSVTAYSPYREYYIYRKTPSQQLLDQLLTIYLATYYYGSITRYKPEKFDEILKSNIGPFTFEFFESQPTQFLYLMASEFMGQEVAKPAIA